MSNFTNTFIQDDLALWIAAVKTHTGVVGVKKDKEYLIYPSK